MWIGIKILIFIVLPIMVINANLLKIYLDDKTKYKKIDIYEQPQILFLFIFLGIFCLPFMKQIKRYRKKIYLEKKLKQLKTFPTFILIQNPFLTKDEIDKEIFSIERYLKLEKLKRK